jgi:hypothetical protein
LGTGSRPSKDGDCSRGGHRPHRASSATTGMLSMLLGCGLRRGELLARQLPVDSTARGTLGHRRPRRQRRARRTVPMPAWVKDAIEAWPAAANITEGTVFRAISKLGRVWGQLDDGEGTLGRRASCGRRSRHHKAGAARSAMNLCPAVHVAGGELDQIQFLLGTSRFRRPSATSDANRSFGTPSTTAWASNPMPLDSTRGQSGSWIRSARLYVTRVGFARVVLPLRPRSQMADKRRNRDDPVAVARHGWRYQTSRHSTLVAARWRAVSRSICVVWAETAPNAVSAHRATAARCLTDPSSSVRIDRARAEALPPTP